MQFRHHIDYNIDHEYYDNVNHNHIRDINHGINSDEHNYNSGIGNDNNFHRELVGQSGNAEVRRHYYHSIKRGYHKF